MSDFTVFTYGFILPILKWGIWIYLMDYTLDRDIKNLMISFRQKFGLYSVALGIGIFIAVGLLILEAENAIVEMLFRSISHEKLFIFGGNISFTLISLFFIVRIYRRIKKKDDDDDNDKGLKKRVFVKQT